MATTIIVKANPQTGVLGQYASTPGKADRYLGPYFASTKGDKGDPGPSAKAAAISAGLLPANATDAQYTAFLQGAPGQAAPTYAAIAGSDFNVLVSGTTQLGTPTTGAAGAVFTISGGDVYYTLTGTAPSSSSMPLSDTTQVQVDPLTDAQAFRCIIKAGAPRLIGYWLKRTN